MMMDPRAMLLLLCLSMLAACAGDDLLDQDSPDNSEEMIDVDLGEGTPGASSNNVVLDSQTQDMGQQDDEDIDPVDPIDEDMSMDDALASQDMDDAFDTADMDALADAGEADMGLSDDQDMDSADLGGLDMAPDLPPTEPAPPCDTIAVEFCLGVGSGGSCQYNLLPPFKSHQLTAPLHFIAQTVDPSGRYFFRFNLDRMTPSRADVAHYTYDERPSGWAYAYSSNVTPGDYRLEVSLSTDRVNYQLACTQEFTVSAQ